MKHTLLLFAFVYSLSVGAQEIISQQFSSSVTGHSRTLRIGLPKSYANNSNQNYPLIFCFDGDYTFYSVLGAMIPMKYAETVPEAIIVGIDQNVEMPNSKTFFRWIDGDYTKSGTLDSSGLLFKEMLFDEIIPMLDSSYRLSPYMVIVGHSFTATLASLLFMEKQSPFSGYIAVSPYLPKYINQRLVEHSNALTTEKWFYTSFGGNDLSGHIATGHETKRILEEVNNANFHFKSDSIPEASHFSLVYSNISEALKFVFEPISNLNYNDFESYLELEYPLAWYKDRMNKQEALTGNSFHSNIDDLYLLAYLASEKADWNTMLEIGEYTIKLFPNHLYGYYILGDAYMEMHDYERALKQFQLGYDLIDESVTNKADFYESIELAKSKLVESH